MSNFRITTNELYRTYRTNLNKNNQKLSNAMVGVETERKFNTYAEDPAAASKAWRLRRSYWRTGDQIDNNNYIISKYESAYSAMAAIVDGDVGNGEYGLGLAAILPAIEGTSDASGSARAALGKELIQTADNIVSMMNGKYGDEFVFAGADGANIPFTWSADKSVLLYRGVDVSTPKTEYKSSDFDVTEDTLKMAKPLTQAEYNEAVANNEITDESDRASYADYLKRNTGYDTYEDAQKAYTEAERYRAAKEDYEEKHAGYAFEKALKLNDMANEETYVDIGIGLQEDGLGELIEGSAFNSAISGLSFLGYGEDENIVMIIKELGTIFSNSDPDTGEYTEETDRARVDELLNKLHSAVRNSQDKHTQLSADSKYLQLNLNQLKTTRNELDNQIVDTEDLDMAEAITNMNWAQYCYNAALRIGTNILSQSLIDYMN